MPPAKVNIDFNLVMQPKQMKLWHLWNDERCTRVGFGGARGGAKSGGGRRLMLYRRFLYPNTTGLILRRTYPELYRSHIVKLFEEWPEFKRFWRAESKELILPNGSRQFFGSAEHEGDMAQYYSAEFADIMVDEAQEFSQSELERLSGSNRCTSNAAITPSMIFTFMPGLSEAGIPPKGLAYLKRVFVDGELRESESLHKWAFVQAFSWDNMEWARVPLQQQHPDLTEQQRVDLFYGWKSAERREYFLRNTDFGRVLASITNKHLREAWLDGRWDIFQGQYFPQWSYDTDTIPAADVKVEPWHRTWISGDWGFDHPACFYLHSEDENGVITTVDEYWVRGASEDILGRTIGGMWGKHRINKFLLSWDAFGRLHPTTKKSIVDQIAAALPYSMPRPEPADASPGSRISGWRLMSNLIDKRMWKISRKCEKLIECIPTLIRDMERNSEDVLKVDWSDTCIGDDPADAARYGLQNMVKAPTLPYEVVRAQALQQVPANLDGSPNITSIHMKRIKMDDEHSRANVGLLLRKHQGRVAKIQRWAN